MQKLKIVFDIDGTLRCNCTPTCEDSNPPIVSLVNILKKYFKNIEVYAWSGGGKAYAWNFVRTHGLGNIIKESHCYGKLDPNRPQFDIAIDDQQEFALAEKNLIVRLK